ncbi:hypothetical protein DLR68_04105 [Vibrio paracholerae]|nr:hypothetical protein DLR68_04105 [Vibrio paracholerae]
MCILRTITLLKEEGLHAISVVPIIFGKKVLEELTAICGYITASNARRTYIAQNVKYNKRLKRDCQRVAFPVPLSRGGFGCCV